MAVGLGAKETSSCSVQEAGSLQIRKTNGVTSAHQGLGAWESIRATTQTRVERLTDLESEVQR